MKIAVIPARGGSKRIPRKNIRNFCGKPIIAYSIEAALESQLFDHVIVSTDDDEIASVASGYGAEIPFVRPSEISGDHVGTNEVVKPALEWSQARAHSVSLACCIYATAPFVGVEYLREGHDKLLNDPVKHFSFSVTTFPFPIQRAIRINRKGEIEAFWPEYNKTRSQDLEDAYHDAGQFYWGRHNAFLNDEMIFSNSSIPVILPRYLVQDIDTNEDWRRAELMFEALSATGARS